MTTPDIITFTKVRLPYGWLSNMSPHPIEWQLYGEEYEFPTCEHLFQAMRFNQHDHDVREQIAACKSPMAAKMTAKRYANRMAIAPRSADDVENMQLVLLAKVHVYEDLRRALLDTGEARLVEDVTARPNESGLFWGMARRGDEWLGQNVLGDLWCKTRKGIRDGVVQF